MQGIYMIRNNINKKVYIGKAKDIKRRLISHKTSLRKSTPNKKLVNRYLYNAVQKYGWDNFDKIILENVEDVDKLAERELFWMDLFRSYNSLYGYNLRRDSATKMIVHEDTKKLLREMFTGEGNPNFGNKWSDKQKNEMSELQKQRYIKGEATVNYEAIKKGNIIRQEKWDKNPELKELMSKRVSVNKSKYDYLKIDIITGEILEEFETFMKLKDTYKDVGKTVVMSVCNGHKLQYKGFLWRYRDKETMEIIIPELQRSKKPDFYYSIEGNNYLKVGDASSDLKIPHNTISFRLKSSNFSNYQKLPLNNPYL